MYQFDVFLINFGYVCGCYKTLEQAIKAGKKTGFEFAVYENFPNKMVWSSQWTNLFQYMVEQKNKGG